MERDFFKIKAVKCKDIQVVSKLLDDFNVFLKSKMFHNVHVCPVHCIKVSEIKVLISC